MSHLLSLRHCLTNSIRYTPTNCKDVAKSMFFGFSLLGVVGRHGRRTSPQLIHTIQKGLSFLKNDNYIACEQTFRVALKMAMALKNSRCITFIYDMLANLAYMNNKYEEAKDLFLKVIGHLFKQGGHEDDLKILHLSLKLSKIHEALNDKENSEIGYIYCVRHLEEKIIIYPENKDVLGLYAIALDTYGRYLLTEKQHTKVASSCYKKAYKASVKLNGQVFEMNASLLNDLGTIDYTQGQFNQAIHYFKKAEEIGQYLPAMKSFSMVHINLCYIYLQEGMFEEAEKHLKEGKKNAIKHDYDEGKKEAEICYAEMKKLYKM